ncbi:MAG: hypothetical protein QM765_07670 [Myxococcales bacterium]
MMAWTISHRARGLLAQGQDGPVGLGLVGPLDQQLGLREEGLGLGLVHAGLAAAVVDRALHGDDVLDRLLEVGVLGGVDGDHPVAVELGGGEGLGGVVDVGDRHLVGGLLAQVVEQPPRTGQHARVADGGERDAVAALEQVAGLLEDLLDPGDGRQDLGSAHAPVLVRVQDVQGARVELDAAGGHRQRDPQLLVQPVQRDDVRAVPQHHLIDSTRPEELPTPRRVGHRAPS